jgi:subtilisin-like proprotein convertase family protein
MRSGRMPAPGPRTPRLAARFLLALSLLAISIVNPAQAQVRTVPLGAEKSRLTLVRQDDRSYTYTLRVGDLQAMDVSTPEGGFSRLLIPGYHSSMRIGAPQLPMMNRLCRMPYGAGARVEVVSQTSRTISLADYGIVSPLLPAQPSMPKNADPAKWPFVYNRAAYAAPRVTQDLVRVVDLGQLRALHLGRIEVSPLEYLPAGNQIVVHDEIEFRVVFDPIDRAAEEALAERTFSPFFENIYAGIDGYRNLQDQYPDRVRDAVTMVIITPPQFEPYLEAFAAWKTQRGFHVIEGVIGTPEVGTTKESIQAYIRALYNNPPAPYASPSFVVLVGDVDTMPTWTLDGHASDRPYCTVDSDLMPEIYYGRLSCANPTQLQAILSKTLMYDQYTMPDPRYLGRACLIAGYDDTYAQVYCNGQVNYGTTYYFNVAHGITASAHLFPQSALQAAQIIQEVSDGVAFANYSAHGVETEWQSPLFTQADVNGLQNAGKYCLAVANCCQTAQFDYPECIGETFLRASDKGAIGYIGASYESFWDEDYWWSVGYRAQIVEHPTFDPEHPGAYDGLFHDHGEPASNWYVVNDALVFAGNLAVTEAASGNAEYYWNIYNLLGDPSLSAYLGVPAANPVAAPDTLLASWDSLGVTAAPGSYVGLTREGELVGAGTTNAEGHLTLPIWGAPLAPGPAHLVVTAQNRVPFQADLAIITPAVVQLNPNVIAAGVPASVDVLVLNHDGVTPRAGVDVWAAGVPYESAHAVTGADGHATLSITYPYGPSLDIIGRDPGANLDLFRTPLSVTAEPLDNPFLRVTTSIGLSDTLGVGFPAVLHARISEPGHTLFAFLNGTQMASTTDTTLTVTPGAIGLCRGVIAVGGHDLYTRDFPVVQATGSLAGEVRSGGSPIAGAVVRGYGAADQLVFEAISGAGGAYTPGSPVPCGGYTIKVDYLGCLHFAESIVVNHGANTFDIFLDPAPLGVITGTVLDQGTSVPLAATIDIYRSDTMALYAQTSTNAQTGVYTTPSLPYFAWTLRVSASSHSPDSASVSLDQPSVTQDFRLTQVEQGQACRIVGTPIPDDNAIGITDHLTVNMGGTIVGIEVYLNITHTYVGDLVVRLRSPQGAWITLHNRTGSDSNNIQGWYPTELTPAEPLDAFVNQSPDGVWSLNVSDNAADDVGTLNRWCLRVTHTGGASQTAEPPLPESITLHASRPNPFSASASLRFDLPRRDLVDLAVFDVTGRRVTTLCSAVLEAGSHQRLWEGRDGSGNAVAGGVYFCRLRAEGRTFTQRVTLLR